MTNTLLWNEPFGPTLAGVLAATFIGWWRADPARRYHLCWGITFLANVVASTLIPAPGRTLAFTTPPTVLLAIGTLAQAALVAGCLDYRGRLTPRMLRALVTIGVLLWVGVAATPPELRPPITGAVDTVVLIVSAACLWDSGRMERAIGALFLLRAVNGSFVLSLLSGGKPVAVPVYLNLAIALTLGIMLLAASYLRARRELETSRNTMRETVRARTAALERSEADLVLVNRELDAFTYGVSHDLRAPLRSVLGFGQMLAEDCGESLDAGARHTLEALLGQAHSLSRLVDRLLDFARQLRQEPHFERVDLGSLVQRIAASNGHDCRVEPALEVTADARALETAIGLLLERNAAAETQHVQIDLHRTAPDRYTLLIVPPLPYCDVGASLREAMATRLLERCAGRLWPEAGHWCLQMPVAR